MYYLHLLRDALDKFKGKKSSDQAIKHHNSVAENVGFVFINHSKTFVTIATRFEINWYC